MIRLRTLGSLDLRAADGRELRSVLVQPKRLALLVYLALAAPRGFQRRDRLLGLFWPDLDETHARGALSQSLHVLRRALGEGVLVSRGDEEVGLAEGTLGCDAAAFDDALAEGRLDGALELYRGDLLEGFFLPDTPEFERWLEEERRRLRERAVKAALALAGEAEERGDPGVALEWAQRAEGLAPHDEAALHCKLQIFDEQGERARALRAYEEFARRLDTELGVEPSPALQALVAAIRSRSGGTTVEPPRSGGPVRAPAPSPAAELRAPPRARIAPAGALAAAAVAALLLGAGLWWTLRGEAAPPAPAPAAEQSVAVLPFVNLSSDPEQEYFSDGLTEELLTALAQVPGLRVAGRTSSFAFKRGDVPADSVARRLRVAHLVSGSVRRSGSRIRVSAQLVRADSGYQLWSQTYDRELTEIFAIQDEIARSISQALRIRLAGGETARLVSAATGDSRAYDLFLQGQTELEERDMNKAIARFEEAIERDPRFARAHAGLAYALAVRPYYDPAVRASESRGRGRALADRALALDSMLAEAHLASGAVRLNLDWDFAAAERELRRAVELNPNYADAHLWLAQLLAYTGRDDQAVAAISRAAELDPLSYRMVCNVPRILAHARRFEAAVKAIEKAIEGDLCRSNPTWMGTLYLMAGRYGEAARLYQEGAKLSEAARLRLSGGSGDSGRTFPTITAVAAEDILGPLARGERPRTDRLRRREQELGGNPRNYLIGYAVAGDADNAMRLMDQWYEERNPELFWVTGPEYDALRPDPRYRAVVAKIGLRIRE